MKKHLLLSVLLMATLGAFAQDAYHQYLNTTFQTDYTLPPVQQWALPNTETATLAGSVNYTGSTNTLTVSGQPFSQGVSRTVTLGSNPWDAGHLYPSTGAVGAGDKCLFVIWLRSSTPGARVNIFVENSSTYEKEVYATLVLSNTWKLYAAPFESSTAYGAGQMNLGLHLAMQDQTVEIGGAACLNYKNTVDFSQLPILLSNDTYPGAEPDASWRAEAAAGIDQLRKANLAVNVQCLDGQAIEGATVHIAMQQHAFKFGTAVVSNKFNGGSAYNPTYEAKLLDLDGQGHGFNEVVFENDLKWPAWEQGWFSTKAELVSDVQWLHNQGISVRGHNLAWPGWGYSPADINESATPAYIKNRIRNHINEILQYPGIGQEMIDWDVLNEITGNNDYANHFAGTPGYATGRELYREIFQQADSLAPEAVLYLNDYVAIEQGDSPTNGIALWKSRIDELLNAGAPVEGLGFQGHFSASPTGIPRVKEIYDDFWNTYGLEAKVTEYDIDKLAPPAMQAAYLRDVLTITFAHPSMKGFLMWGFWDGAHWLGNAPIYREDWSLKPSGEAFVDQVFHQWWTDIMLTTNAAGQVSTRAFKGKYLVTVSFPDGSSQSQEIELTEDASLDFTLACTVAANEPEKQGARFTCTPNPAGDYFYVQWQNDSPNGTVLLQCFDMTGRKYAGFSAPANKNTFRIDCSQWPSGLYQVLAQTEKEMRILRTMVVH